MITLPDEPWMDRGACAASPEPDLWFSHPSDTRDRALALQICSMCPVQAECLDYALRTRPEFGIWGGLEPNEIRRLLRRKHA